MKKKVSLEKKSLQKKKILLLILYLLIILVGILLILFMFSDVIPEDYSSGALSTTISLGVWRVLSSIFSVLVGIGVIYAVAKMIELISNFY
jgi:uncharacterized membrane protein HdeD (DUF308 family)